MPRKTILSVTFKVSALLALSIIFTSTTFAQMPHTFRGTPDGAMPEGRLVSDSAGNLYVTTMGLGADYSGNIFKLSPSGGSWVYTDLHDLFAESDGDAPWASPVMDAQGNLFGTTVGGGRHNGGTVWQIAP